MAQGIVDLLELVEIDKQQCRQPFGVVGNRQQPFDLVAEIDPIRQRRQFVVAGKTADPGFRILPLGDVFHQHHGAAAGHRLKCPGQRAAPGNIGVGGDDVPGLGILYFREDHLALAPRSSRR